MNKLYVDDQCSENCKYEYGGVIFKDANLLLMVQV